MLVKHDGGGDDVVVDGAWAIATYKDQIESIYTTLVPEQSTTTANGAADGTTIIDTTRTEANDFWNGMTIQIASGTYNKQPRTIKDYDLATGTFTITPAFGGQILADVDYRIVTASLYQPGIQIVPIFPPTVEPDTSSNVSLGMSLITNNGVPLSADLTAGTITIYRIRAAGFSVIVNAAACSKGNGQIYYGYTFPSASWQAGDIYYAVLNGQEVVVNGITYPISFNAIYGRISREAEIVEDLTDIKGTGFVKDTDSLVDLAHTGADGDTLETLSDQIDIVEANTGRTLNVYPTGEPRTITGGSVVGVEDEKE
jgi:hypothetical protein